MSNNVAEYMGLYHLLEWLKNEGYVKEQIRIHGDSKLVVEQISGRWRVKKGMYVEAFKKAYCMAKEFERLKVIWIPRGQNTLADALSKNIVGIVPDSPRMAGAGLAAGIPWKGGDQ